MPVSLSGPRSTGLVALTAAALFVSGSSAEEASDCVCSSSSLANGFSSATQIFVGTVETARLDDAAQTVEFTVEVDSVYRGTVKTKTRLATSLVDQCRIKIYAGKTSVYMLSENQKALSMCDGPFELSGSMVSLFATALDLVENYDVARLTTGSELHQKLDSGASSELIRFILATANTLDPDSSEYSSATRIKYRGLTVSLLDEVVVSYDWK